MIANPPLASATDLKTGIPMLVTTIKSPDKKTIPAQFQAVAKDRFKKMLAAIKADSAADGELTLSSDCNAEIASFAHQIAEQTGELAAAAMRNSGFDFSEDQIGSAARENGLAIGDKVLLRITSTLHEYLSSYSAHGLAMIYYGLVAGYLTCNQKITMNLSVRDSDGNLASKSIESRLVIK